jgi:hypothetical protein
MKPRLLGIALVLMALIVAGCGGSSSHYDGNQNGQHHTPREFSEIHARENEEAREAAIEAEIEEREVAGESREEIMRKADAEAAGVMAEGEREGLEAQGKCYEELQAEGQRFERMEEVCGPVE